ncbi:glycosyl hydrolase family 95 catalytic domain-containing protein [Wocania ichthyoenteri]|uniref:glycosyl hydrolase family 95 catalytic domain-containing protein n=1 Tax=Wocania ichthyoenteri TaxID=1230531 RepID=UPI00053D07AA|nr:hypothetical protein [Wocania ichthyoenteri]
MKSNALILILFIAVTSCDFWNKEIPETTNKLTTQSLTFNKLPKSWDEAIPLGNATIGALVWKKNNKLRFSLDRADLWDLRPMENLEFDKWNFEWVKTQWENNTYKNVQDKFDAPYDNSPAPSKIPAAALEFDIEALGEVKSVELTLKDALCTVTWKNGTILKTFVHATKPIGWYEFSNLKSDINPNIIAPDYALKKDSGVESPVTGQDLRRLGYPKGEVLESDNEITYNQNGWKDFKYQVHTEWKKTENKITGSWSISSEKNKDDKQTAAKELVSVATKSGMANQMNSHESWWQNYWEKSSVTLPDSILQRQWYLEMYKFGAAARQGAPPISLQSVWTADNGKLPPWKGDYHHDLNTQLSYWPAYAGNHLDLEQGFLDWLNAYKPVFKKYTKEFYDADGMNMPGVTTLTGEPMGGWIQYSFGPTVSAWIGQHYYLHWRYSLDKIFLEEQAYPWIKDVAVFLDEISVHDEHKKRRLPLSSSPEINDNSREAWFHEITNYDLALIRFTFSKASELALVLGKNEEADKWKTILSEWPEYAVDDTGLMFSNKLPYKESHRHFSHLMAIHPLGLIDVSNGAQDQEIISKTIENLDKVGSGSWVGYSFSWLGNLKARALDGEGAAKALTDFATSFCSTNSFHVNGDQSGTGKSNFTYRPFTLEGNFAFASGIHEMLIQSHTGIINLFPAIPNSWETVSFENLRTEGAFLISVKMENSKVKEVRIISEKGGMLRLKNPFGKDKFTLNAKFIIQDNVIVISTIDGQKIDLILEH